MNTVVLTDCHHNAHTDLINKELDTDRTPFVIASLSENQAPTGALGAALLKWLSS